MMTKLIESIAVIDGEIRNLNYHQERMNLSRFELLGLENDFDLGHLIHQLKIPINGKFKVRIVYGKEIESIDFKPYQVKLIQSVRLVEANFLNYEYKFEDRKAIDDLKKTVEEDEIMMVQNGQITDTSFSNLVFFDGEQWITPNGFLLNGTMRQSLLDSGKIIEEEINPKDLNRFLSFKLINAMLDLEESPDLDISIIQ